MIDVTAIAAGPPAKIISPRDYDVDAPLLRMAKRFHLLAVSDSRAELAGLNRLNPDHPDNPAFFRLLADCVPHNFLGDRNLPLGAPGSEVDMVRRFATIASIMALRANGLRSWGLGRAMADAGISDQRLSMLLTSRGSVFRDLARRLARRLARDATALPYLDIGRLILMDEIAEHDEEAEVVRIALAREFQNAVRRAERTVDDDGASDDE
jgi:CRISPR system Cascade subunit CasB